MTASDCCSSCGWSLGNDDPCPDQPITCPKCGRRLPSSTSDSCSVTVSRATTAGDSTPIESKRAAASRLHPEQTQPWEDSSNETADQSPSPFDYEIVKEIAKGGMGIVYLAKHRGLNRLVALKMIRSSELANDEQVRRFYAEAQVVARLDHPNIVPIYEFGKHDGEHYFSMGYVEGGNLAAQLAEGPLTPRRAAELVASVAEAVHYAHLQGVVHRDLKPANILLDAAGQPRVSDFGLAKQVASDSSLTVAGQVIGTPGYMPPEQAAGDIDRVGPRSDIYSLGAILYCLLTGRPPFQAANVLETLKQVANEEAVPPRQLNRAVSPDLDTICLKCLEKDPDRRYASAGQLAADLRRFLANEPIRARPIGANARAWRWCKRNPAVAVLGSAAVIFLAVGAVISLYFAVVAEQRATESQQNLVQTEIQSRRADEKAAEAVRAAGDLRKEIGRREKWLYVAQMRLARQAWEDGNVLQLKEILESQRPEHTTVGDLRNFEWHYYNRLLHGARWIGDQHQEAVVDVAFSPDGALIASASLDGTLRIWSSTDGRQIRLLIPSAIPLALAFSPDGRRLAVVQDDGLARILELPAGGKNDVVLQLQGGAALSVAFSPNGRLIALGSHGSVSVWNSVSGQLIATFAEFESSVGGVAFSPNGELLAAATRWGQIKLWRVADWEEHLSFESPDSSDTSYSPDDSTASLVFSPSGSRLASITTDCVVRVWDVDAGSQIFELSSNSDMLLDAAYSPDGRWIAASSRGGRITIWDAVAGKELFALKGHTNRATCVAFDPTTQQLVSGSDDKSVRTWDLRSPLEFATSPGGSGIVECGPDERFFAIGHFGGVWLIDTATGELLDTLQLDQNIVTDIAISSKGSWLAVAHGETITFCPLKSTFQTAFDTDLAVTLTGNWEFAGRVAFDPDEEQLISSGGDGAIRVWKVSDPKEPRVLQGHTGSVHSLALHPSGQWLATGSSTGSIRLWDLTSGQTMRRLNGHRGVVQSLAFSHDGEVLASGGRDHDIILWNSKSGIQQQTLRGHTDNVRHMTFSPDGSRLATSSSDRTVRLWDATSGEEMLVLSEFVDPTGLAFFSAGNRLAVGDRLETRIFDSRSVHVAGSRPLAGWPPGIREAVVAEQPASQLLAHYRFDGDTADASMGGGALQIKNASICDGALYLNGVYSYETGGYDVSWTTPNLNPWEFTVAVRFKAEEFDWAGRKSCLLVAGHSTRWFAMSRNSDGKLTVSLNNGKFVKEFADSKLEAGKWTIVACGMDVAGRKILAYIDGKELAAVDLPEDFKLSATSELAEEHDWTFTNYMYGGVFHGLVDEVQVYDRLLGPQEFSQISPPQN